MPRLRPVPSTFHASLWAHAKFSNQVLLCSSRISPILEPTGQLNLAIFLHNPRNHTIIKLRLKYHSGIHLSRITLRWTRSAPIPLPLQEASQEWISTEVENSPQYTESRIEHQLPNSFLRRLRRRSRRPIKYSTTIALMNQFRRLTKAPIFPLIKGRQYGMSQVKMQMTIRPISMSTKSALNRIYEECTQIWQWMPSLSISTITTYLEFTKLLDRANSTSHWSRWRACQASLADIACSSTPPTSSLNTPTTRWSIPRLKLILQSPSC